MVKKARPPRRGPKILPPLYGHLLSLWYRVQFESRGKARHGPAFRSSLPRRDELTARQMAVTVMA